MIDESVSPPAATIYRVVTRRVAVVLGVVFVLLGVVETVRDVTGGHGGYVFWFTSLCGGGAAILVGVLKLTRRPAISAAAVIIGAMAGALATAWSLVGPLASIILVTLLISDLGKVAPRPARG